MLAVVYFPKTYLDEINSLREKYDVNWKIIPPHITVVSPVTELSEQQLIEEVESVARDFETFPIKLSGLSKAPDGCLFLIVEDGKDKIITLYNKLYSGMLAPYIPTAYQFTPHITLGDFTEPNEEILTQAYSEAQSLNLNFSCMFDALTIIEGDGITPAKTVKAIKLPASK